MPNIIKIQKSGLSDTEVTHIQGESTSQTLWSFLQEHILLTTSPFILKQCFDYAKQWVKFKHHKSHIKPESWFLGIAFSLCFSSKSVQSSVSDFHLQILLQWPWAFSFRGLGEKKKKEKLNTVQKNIATRNQICHMTFSSPELKGHSVSHTDRKALTCTRTDADTKYAPVVSACVHGNTQPRTLSACLPERRSPFSADNPSLFPPVS